MERHSPASRCSTRDIPICRRDPARHTSAIAAAAVLDEARRRGVAPARAGIALTVRKQLPLSGGQGGSAASAVAGAVAADALLGASLDTTRCSSAVSPPRRQWRDGISTTSPRRCSAGSCSSDRSIRSTSCDSPSRTGCSIVLAHPSQRLRTSEARGVLPTSIPRADALHQMAQVGAIVAACHGNDLALLGRAIDDRIAEPARAPLLPGFVEAKRVAMEAGALGASISGAGPTAFAFVAGDAVGERVAVAMREAYATAGVDCTTRVTHVDPNGAVVRTA